MKGTLFSTDFIKDSSGNLRLLEINTDTTVPTSALPLLDFSEFVNVLSSNSITKVTVIYKLVQGEIVDLLEEYLLSNYPNLTEFVKSMEDGDTIYPTSVEDDSDKFILRLAYDESAVLDSEYAKNTHNILKLFADNNNISSTVGYYYSGSEGVEDYLDRTINVDNVPDVLTKNLNTTLGEPIKFHKLGQSSLSTEDRFNSFISQLDDTKVAINFYNDESVNMVESFRTLHIVYGNSLDTILITSFKSSAILEKPVTITNNDNEISTEVDIKHYHEFTTTLPRFGVGSNYGGVFEDEQIVKSDGTLVPISTAEIGDSFKSYFISGSPDTDSQIEYSLWSHPGSELPSGSYPTTSTLINNLQVELFYNMVFNVEITGGSFRISGNTHLLVYIVDEDRLKYMSVSLLNTTNYKILSFGSGLVDITSITCEILEGTYSTHILDLEEADVYLLGDNEVSVKIIAHNCFPAGTKITMSDGSVKNIEDVKSGDKLLTFNEENNNQSEGVVGNVLIKKDKLLIEFKFNDGGSIQSTPFHRYFVEGSGWVNAQDIKLGDKLVRSNGYNIEIISIDQHLGDFDVYHIIDVRDNHTYYAEDVLVHNYKFCFKSGTKITLVNGDIKNIEDVVVGEEVLTYNEESGINEIGIVGDLKQHEVNLVIRLTLDNENVIVTTSEHPFFVEGKGWVKSIELQPLDVCKKVDGSESLISTVEVLEETHTVYNLLSVSENHNFYANGILVHNKK